MLISSQTLAQYRRNLATGHSETWLATFITLWGIGIILFSWWLVSTKHASAKWLLATILLYEVLP